MCIDERIKEANILRYNNGEQVNQYMKEEYHKVRLEIVIRMLNSQMPKINRERLKVLELASGDGSFSMRIRKYGYQVYCSDIATEHLEKLSKGRITVQEVDVTKKFPFHEETFDAIIAGDIVEHLFDIDIFFKECSRVLKRKGILIVTTPNLASLQDRIQFLSGETPKQIQPCHEFYKLHIRPFTIKLLRKVYQEYGFEIMGVKSNYVIWKHKQKYIIYSRLLARIFPGIGRSLIVCGKKI